MLFGSTKLIEKKWEKGETFLKFLENYKLPLKLYYNLNVGDKELTSEIAAKSRYQILKDSNGTVKQVLIPVGEELQIHIGTNKNGYFINTIPIIYKTKYKILETSIASSAYKDIIKLTNNYLLANEFVQSYKKSINFKRDIRKGDKLVIIYTQKIRLGRQFGNPLIEASMVETRGRAHLGIDYAASVGTPVSAAANGKVIFAGKKGGYGNCIIIRHIDGYKTLYAHLRKFARSIRRGKYVKKGKTIGYVGTTGLSTGPHLHFGLYKNNHAINPANTIKVTKSILNGKKRKAFLQYIKKYNKEIQIALTKHKKLQKESNFAFYMPIKK